MIVQYNSDITKVTRGIIVNGVNCQYAMGSGLAKALYTKWPSVREEYMETLSLLGRVHLICVEDLPKPKVVVANCYTQEFYGYDGRRYASMDAIRVSMESVIISADMLGLPIHMAKVGCDLGGLSWVEEVEPYLDSLNACITVHEIKDF